MLAGRRDCDSHRLHQATVPGSAIKASAAESSPELRFARLTLRCGRDCEAWWTSVADRGGGFSAARRDRHWDAGAPAESVGQVVVLQRIKLVEAAGIEPGQLDDLGGVSPRHLAQVRDPPGEMGSPRALSRVANRHPAGSVDQRDHGGPAQRSQPRSMGPTSCSCSGPTAAHVAVALSGNSPSAICNVRLSIIYGLTTERAALNGGARGGARMRTLVAGIGALGGTIATRAVSAGVPVRLATRTAESARLLRSAGLRVAGIGGAAVASGLQVGALEEYRGESFDLIVLACLSPVAPRATAASRRARYTPPRRVASLAEADRSRQLRGRTTDPHAALAHRLSGPLSGARGGWRRESRRRGRDRRRPQRGPAPARPPTRSASAAHARGGRGPACHAMACARGNPRGRQPFPRRPLQSSPAP